MEESKKDAQIAYNVQIENLSGVLYQNRVLHQKKNTISKFNINLFKGFFT